MIPSALGPFLLALPALVLSDYQLAGGDVPDQCSSICQPVVNLTSTCDAGGNSSIDARHKELLEKQCICLNDSFDVANRTALCASCINQDSGGNGTILRNGTTVGNGTSVGNDTANWNSTEQRDINSIMSACGFPSHTFAPNMTTATSANVTATPPTGTEALTTTISTGVPVATGDESAAMKVRIAAAGALGALVGVAMMAL